LAISFYPTNQLGCPANTIIGALLTWATFRPNATFCAYISYLS